MERLSSGKSLEEIKEEFYKTKAVESTGDSPYQEVGDSDEDEYTPLLDYTEKLSETVSIKEKDIPEAPFYGDKVLGPEDIDLDEMWQYLNLDALIIGQWRMGKGKKTPEEYQVLLDNEIYPTLERLKKRANPWLKPKIVYGYYPCKIDPEHPNKLNLFDNKKKKIIDSFLFPRQKNNDHLCLSDYFRAENDAFNLVAFQLVTIGVEAAEFVQELYKSGDFAEYLYYYGLATESTEALAEYAHARIRAELGYKSEDNTADVKKLLRGDYHGMRYSFGYPACPRLEDQEKLFTLLKPERIGMKLSEEWQIHPEHSTSAIVIHHPDAKYYNVKVK